MHPLAQGFQSLLTAVPLPQTGIQAGDYQQYLAVTITHVVGGLLCYDLARRKHRHLMFWTWIGFLFGPLAAIILLLLPAQAAREQRFRL